MKFLLFLLFIVLGGGFGSFFYKKKKEELETENRKIMEKNQQSIINTGVLLEINIEKDSEVDIAAISQVWTYFNSIADVDNELFHPYLSLEIKALRDDYLKKDEVVFYIWIPRRFKNMIMSRFKTVYPGMVIKESKEDFMIKAGDKRSLAMANLGLEKNYIYSIKNFDSIKDSDPLSTIVSTMSKLENKETCIMQVLLKPVNDSWKEEARDYLKDYEIDGILPSTSMTIVEKIKFYLITALKALLLIPIHLIMMKPSDIVEKHKDMFQIDDIVDKGKVENEEIKNIAEKVMDVGYSVDIKVIVATPYFQKRAENKLNEICSSFRELDGDNKIIRKPIEERKYFLLNMSKRWYPLGIDNDILSTKEISAFCHFPNANHFVTLKHISTKIVECPPGLSTENLLGYGMRNGLKVPVGIDTEARFRHMWIAGQTGTGKSTIMENMIVNDIHNGAGLMLIDPHGETALHIAERCATIRKDIYYLDLSDIMNPPTINLFQIFNTDYNLREQEKTQIVENFIVIFKRVFGSASIGPNSEDILRNSAYAVIENPNGASMLDVYLMLTSSKYRKKVLQFLDDKAALKSFWEETFAKMEKDVRYQQQNLNAPLNKLRRFINDPNIANMVCPKHSTINVKQIMDTGAVLLINLSKGRLGELTSNVIGSMLVSQVQISAMMRSGLPEHKMTPFFLYIDEFENFIGGEGGAKAFESMLSECRKYKLGLIMANQYMSQLESGSGGGSIKSAIFGNCGTTGVYRVGNEDAKELEEEFGNNGKGFTRQDLVSTDKFTMCIRLMNDSKKSDPFTLFVNPPHTPHSTSNPDEIKRYSKELLTMTRQDAQKEIMHNMIEYEEDE